MGEMIWKATATSSGIKCLHVRHPGETSWKQVKGSTETQYRAMQAYLLEDYKLLKSPPDTTA